MWKGKTKSRLEKTLQGERMERSPVSCNPAGGKSAGFRGLWLCSVSILPERSLVTIPKQYVTKLKGLDENYLVFNLFSVYKNSV